MSVNSCLVCFEAVDHLFFSPYCRNGHFSLNYPDEPAHFECLVTAFENNSSCSICRDQITNIDAIKAVVGNVIVLFEKIDPSHHQLNRFLADIEICVDRHTGTAPNNVKLEEISNIFLDNIEYIATEIYSDLGRFSIALLAPIKNGLFLQFASAYQNTPAFVYAAVMQNGLALKYASPELQDDLYIVYAALKQNPIALKYASLRLRNNLHLVLFAVRLNGLALRYASDTLKRNLFVLAAAYNQNNAVFHDIPEDLRVNVVDSHGRESGGRAAPLTEVLKPNKFFWSLTQHISS